MRKIIICTSLLLTIVTSFAQQSPSTPFLTREELLRKGKRQETFAWILMSEGIVTLAVTGISAAVTKTGENVQNFIGGVLGGAPPQHTRRSYALPITVGLASIVGSIPLFSAASKNKKEAMNASLSLKLDEIPALHPKGLTSNVYPSLAMKVRL